MKGIDSNSTLCNRIQEFIESEGKSCSMDICGITPEYVYRIRGGAEAIEEIAAAMEEIRRKTYAVR